MPPIETSQRRKKLFQTGFAVSWGFVILYDVVIFGLTVYGARRLRENLPMHDQLMMASMEHTPLSIVDLILRDGTSTKLIDDI
jgi:hypothetical protein